METGSDLVRLGRRPADHNTERQNPHRADIGGSFTPLIRVETATGELAKTQRRSLADALQQSGGEDGGSVVFPPVLVQMLDRLESEILADRVSEESRRWLASCGLTVEQIQNQMDPVYAGAASTATATIARPPLATWKDNSGSLPQNTMNGVTS